YQDKIIAVKSGKHIATAFHPELTGDTRIHKYFIKEALNCAE
ncbi:MAG: pyridoxal 5'-phosphate synthase glutaminase subunit PdxT, partial [Methanobacterium sp.]